MGIVSVSTRSFALIQGLLATMIWSSSFVVSKIGLQQLAPFTIVGLQYIIAFLVLLPLLLRRQEQVKQITPHVWKRLFAIGVSAYVMGNGTLIWGLQYLPAATGALLLSFSPLLVLFIGIIWLKEIPRYLQMMGVLLVVVGSVTFFLPGVSAGQPLGVLVVSLGLIGFALFSILGREMARVGQTNTLLLTAFPFAFGGGILLVIAFLVEGMPTLSLQAIGVIFWLAVIDTAIAYALYNRSLRILTAMEMNVLLALSPLGTALLGWLLLGEELVVIQIIGILIVVVGIFLVQQFSRKENKHEYHKVNQDVSS